MSKIVNRHFILNALLTKVAVLLFASFNLNAQNNNTLDITPTKCVALTQGQTCYVDVMIKWVTTNKGNYCLYSSQQEKAIRCWQQEKEGNHSAELAADKNVNFILRTLEQKQLIAEQQLKVTWVHQKRGQPRLWWRIF